MFSVHSNHMFYLVCLVFQGLVYAFRIHQDIAEKWFYFWSQCWIKCSNGSEGFVRTTITFPCLWNCSHTLLAKYVSAIGNVKFDVSFSCITEQHIAPITMNPKCVHFCPASQILSSIFYETVGFLVMWFSMFTVSLKKIEMKMQCKPMLHANHSSIPGWGWGVGSVTKLLLFHFISISFDLAVFFEFWQSCETKNIYTLVNHLSYPLQLWILQKYTPVSKYINYINMIYKFTKIRIRNFENWNFKILSFSWAHFPWSFSAKGKTSSSAEKVDFEIIDKLYLRHLSS